MRTAYRSLAFAIAGLVVVQAASIAFAFFGLLKWVNEGGTLDTAAMESQSIEFTGVLGFPIHFMNGQLLIPLVALALLVVSFFAKIPGGVKWAAITLGLVVLQVLLGMFGHGLPYVGLLHGLNALILFSVAGMVGSRVQKRATTEVGKSAEPELV